MSSKTTNRHRVDFFATGRLAEIYRAAARQNKLLKECAAFYELGRVSRHSGISGHGSHLSAVVLSHPDDEHLPSPDTKIGRLVSKAFHMLLTDPATHPGQVAQWMRMNKIRSEDRLHVVKVSDLDAPDVSDLLGRICLAFSPDDTRGSIIDAYLSGDLLLVRGPMHRMLHVPIKSLPSLRGQPREVIQNFVIDPDGSFIQWPDLDVHLGWSQFLQAVDPNELLKAKQRSDVFNHRYGAAIRKMREKAGIPQSKVEGLTERQLRRIEQGESRATRSALDALAKAHGLSTNEYMDGLAKAMK